MPNESVPYIVAFIAGCLTFFSPCLLPLIPSYIVYITGVSFADLKGSGNRSAVRKKAAVHSLLFILGFSAIFILLGLSATLLGQAMIKYQDAIRIAGGILVIIFGLNLTGVLRLDFLMKERKFALPAKGASYIGSFLVGVTFAAAWTPCAGPILGSILVIAGTRTDAAQGLKLLAVYSLGIGLPFFLSALAVNTFLGYFEKIKHVIKYINIIGGIFLVIIGALLAANYFNIITIAALRFFSQ